MPVKGCFEVLNSALRRAKVSSVHGIAPVWSRLYTRLGKCVELLPAAYGLHMGINISRICSHLWPRASRDAAHRNSPSSASRAIARAFCPTVIAPYANANLSEADGAVGAR